MRLREYRLEEMGLANTKATARTLRIAPNWTPKQATAVYEVLDDLIDVIWRLYGPDIQQVFKSRAHVQRQRLHASEHRRKRRAFLIGATFTSESQALPLLYLSTHPLRTPHLCDRYPAAIKTAL